MNVSHVSVSLLILLTELYLAQVDGLSNNGNSEEGDLMAQPKRYLMTQSGNGAWVSWRQRVACMTTCIHSYEAETVACCTTGDNRLCLNLPFATLNNSIGSCPDFCQRRSAITCSGSNEVCGSDGVTYSNRCELSKAICDNASLKAVKSEQCSRYTTTAKPTVDPLMVAFCGYRDSITCPTGIDMVCSSTKKLYKNRCDFSKAVCDDLTMTTKDLSFCRS